MNLVEDGDDDNTEGGENVDAIAGGAGVLGLIHQFQRVNKDSRGRTAVGL